ncbi:CBS domain-containing protein CBSX5-like [Lolium rigidum]|uniref:CBS domain-containing protein CBSX5-like n=1 Tax=Lolium rigidum TaxID=89674 RepID=UPI001F5D828B|nr:CBS domain-containing protein CBSX5-like [Lolium rigidum]
MASSILSHVVSDLCIGKPAVRVLPQSTPIAAALATLRAGADPFVFVDAASSDAKKTATAVSVVKVSVAEILCYVCGDSGNLGDPAAALSRPVSMITAAVGDHGVTRRVDPQTSLLDAIDVLLANNSHSLVVPLHARAGRKKHHHHHVPSASSTYCVLTQQDIVRHLFGSISHFSPVAALTVASLGLIRRDVHAVHVDDDALDAIPLLQTSIRSGTAVAVVADDSTLVGEICPGVLGSCDVESVSAAFAALSAGDVMTYIDCYFSPPEFLLRSVRARLTEKGLHAMRNLMDAAYTPDAAALSSSTSSSDEESPLARSGRARRMSSGTGSFRWRSTEDVAACHAGNSLLAVMAQALAHRVGHVWVVEEVTGALVGVVSCADVLAVLRNHLRPECYSDEL